ncbi:hypothetical protein [Marinobacter sp. HL-58]|uniref:hypothetical protein n=1 Tax=Marinobacter sp. HL-58 TaxID=1479237 RepID=UPI00068CC24A|nr:hypothetical protein [Marinobacter sp. HL-58]KPP99755.1 MAG: hypothetical protein HLUCCO03_15625 [Marinobacter sp. HL-58]
MDNLILQSATRAFLALSVATALVLTAGCGGGDDAIDDARDSENSFPPAKNANDDFTSGTTGDSSDSSGLERNQVRVTMEVPESVAPDGEATRRNLRIVEPDTISVYRTDQSLRELASVDTRSRREETGRTVITFEDGLPQGPDVIIEATYGNIRMRALAADADRDVKVNPFSEYLVVNALGNYTGDEFSRIMDCVNDADSTLCLNKYVWSTLADQVHDFEIDIPGNLGAQGALTLLEERGDFARYVSSMANLALLGEDSSGRIEASSADYHSVFWAVELGQTFRESTLAGSGQWGVRVAREETVTDENGTGYIYPGLTLTSFDAFNIRVTSLASDIPYDRKTLVHRNDNEFFERTDWERNTHSSSPGAATLEDEIRLLAGRALFQSITGRGSSEIIGWTRNPYYLDAYAGGGSSEPDRVIGGYFTAGKAIELRSESGELKRERTLEDHYLSVFELNLLREEGFERQALDGRDYNVVYLATRMGDENRPMVVESGLGEWQINGPTVTQAMTTTMIRRDDTGTVTVAPGARDATWEISERPSRVWDPNEGNRIVSNGRLNLDTNPDDDPDDTPDIAIGASTPDGALLGFNLDTNAIGEGLMVAAEQANASPPASGQYRLQGATLGMAQSSNRLAHFDNARLVIESSGSARLDGQRLDIVHQVDDETVSVPQALVPDDVSLDYSANVDGTATFTNSDGTLTMDGFFTADRDQFILQLRDTDGDEEILGLVIATRLPD